MLNVIATEKFPIKSWVSEPEEGALKQARNLANLPFVHKWVSLMPDCHQGYGMPVGSVLAVVDAIIPSSVGVDIGCGMSAVKTNIKSIDTDQLKIVMNRVRETVPVGFHHQEKDQAWEGFDRAPFIPIIQQELKSSQKQLGTLGSGNHFMEFQEDEQHQLWIMLHSGSRNFGLKVANVYHAIAQQLCSKWHVPLPDKDLAFLPADSQYGLEYIEAMNFCLEFARANRELMMKNILIALECGEPVSSVNIHHNYAALENHYGKNVWVHRKGATRARLGELGIIPGSMGSSSYIVEGLGNPESFHSCSHGAGRRMGRKDAERRLNLAEEQAKMVGIVHGLRNIDNLDEAPGAYKDIDTVMANQTDLVKIAVKLRPIGSIKG
jgi:tRNA-splicing ligase RtcB